MIQELSVRRKILLAGMVTLLGIEMSMLFGGASVLAQILTAALFFPVANLVYNAGVFLYSIYQCIFDKTVPLKERLRHNFLVMTTAALNITAYSLVIAVAAVTTPVVSILLVVAAAFGIIGEGYQFFQLWRQGKAAFIEKAHAPQERARLEIEYDKRRNDLVINTTSAVVLTCLVVVWCFVPGGVLVSAGILASMGLAFLAMGIVSYITKLAREYNASVMAARLESKFCVIEDAENLKLGNETQLDSELAEDNASRLDLSPTQQLTFEETGVTKTLTIRSRSTEAPISAGDLLMFKARSKGKKDTDTTTPEEVVSNAPDTH